MDRGTHKRTERGPTASNDTGPAAPPNPANAAVVPPTPAVSCGHFYEDLDTKLEKYIDHKTLYPSYFFNVGMTMGAYQILGEKFKIPKDDVTHRCIKCGRTIDEHPRMTASPPTQPFDIDTVVQLPFNVLRPTRRVGRVDFYVAVKKVVGGTINALTGTPEPPALVEFEACIKQNTKACVLQAGSGTGKTYATLTLRDGLRALGVDYEVIGIYVGFNTMLSLTQAEVALMAKSRGDIGIVMKCVGYSRFAAGLRSILLGVRDAQTLAYLDVEGSSVQAQPSFKMTPEYHIWIASPEWSEESIVQGIARDALELCNIGKRPRLIVFAIIDELQNLDEIYPTASTAGGARLALRIFRELQCKIFRETQGRVLVMPIGTGIDAKASLSNMTDGTNVFIGLTGDEALLHTNDFGKLCATQCIALAKQCATAKTPPTKILKEHHRAIIRQISNCYPVVRVPLMNFPSLLRGDLPAVTLGYTICFSGYDVMSILASHINNEPMDPRHVPIQIPVIYNGDLVLPTFSIPHWKSIHDALRNAVPQRYRFPLSDVIRWANGDSLGEMWNEFQTKFGTLLGYILWTFGRQWSLIKPFLQTCPLLRKWAPTEEFEVVGVWHIKTDDCCMPFVGTEHSHIPMGEDKKGAKLRKNMGLLSDGNDLTCDIVATMKTTGFTETWHAIFMVFLRNAPLDFVLISWRLNEGVREIRVSYADAKHFSSKGTKLPAEIKEVRAKSSVLQRGFESAFGSAFPGCRVLPLDEDFSRVMVCTNITPGVSKKYEDCLLSPKTFVWRPWTDLLFNTFEDTVTETYREHGIDIDGK